MRARKAKWGMTVVFAVVLAFGLALAGCPGDGGTEAVAAALTGTSPAPQLQSGTYVGGIGILERTMVLSSGGKITSLKDKDGTETITEGTWIQGGTTLTINYKLKSQLTNTVLSGTVTSTTKFTCNGVTWTRTN